VESPGVLAQQGDHRAQTTPSDREQLRTSGGAGHARRDFTRDLDALELDFSAAECSRSIEEQNNFALADRFGQFVRPLWEGLNFCF
jgi:hypothetical protein